MTCMRSMTNGCHGGSTADGRNRKSPAPPSSASAATSTRPPPCASIGVYSYTPILAGDAPPPLLHEQVVQRLASQAFNGRPFLGRDNTTLFSLEQPRVGKRSGSTFRSRWAPDH